MLTTKKKKVVIFLVFSVMGYVFLHNCIPNFHSDYYQEDNKREATCLPKQNMMFLKVHKAGSSTLFVMLYRFAFKRMLNIVLPDKKNGQLRYNYLGDGRNLSKDMILPIPEGEHYNILCNHVFYNRTVFEQILPNSTFYFAIVRDPEEGFISSALYYGVYRHLPNWNSSQYVFSSYLTGNFRRPKGETLLDNSMARDFGILPQYLHNQSYVHRYLTKLDSEFDLVLIMEYFDESLVLLRRRMCWSMKDILYLKNNVNKNKIKYKLSVTDHDNLKKYLLADNIIYEHFIKQFWKEVMKHGADLHAEVRFFKSTMKKVISLCTEDLHVEKEVHVPTTKWSESFTVNKSDCAIMRSSELSLLQKAKLLAQNKFNRTNSEVS